MKKTMLAAYCGSLLIALPAQALTRHVDAFVDLSTEYTDNANKTDLDPVSERQDRVSLGGKGTYQNRLVDFTADYVFSDYRYSEDSQPDRNMLEGQSTLYLGNNSKLFELTVMHTRKGVLGDPEQLDLMRNYDEREIVSIYPGVQYLLTPVDMIFGYGIYTDTNYRRNNARDSRQEGAAIGWMHKFSDIDSFSVNLSSADITFPAAKDRSYRQDNAMLSYTSALRNLSYTLGVGYNWSEIDSTRSYSSPSYQADIAYKNDTSGVRLYADRMITNTSMGDGHRFDPGNIDRGDVASSEIDQMDRKNVDLEVYSNLFCAVCSVNLRLGWRNDDYLDLPDDNTEKRVSLGFSYDISPRTKVTLQFSKRKQEFSGGSRSSYDSDRQAFIISRDFHRDISVRVYVEQEKRDSDDLFNRYDELASGIGVRFNF